TQIDLHDSLSSDPLDITLSGGPHANFGAAQATLESIRDEINAAEGLPWSAKVIGLRLVLLPEFGGDDADHNAYVTTTGGAGLHDAYFWATGTGNVHRYNLGGFGTDRGDFQNGSQQGLNGSIPDTQAHYVPAWETASREIDIYNMMILPRSY